MGLAGAGQVLGIGFSLIGSAQKSKAQKRQAANIEREAALRREFAQINADKQRAAANDDAKLILERARVFRSSQIAAQASQGVLIGEGSTQQIVDRTNALASADALVSIYEGLERASAIETGADFEQRRAQAQAGELRTSARATMVNGFTNAIGGLAGAFMQPKTPILNPVPTSTGLRSGFDFLEI